VGYLRNRPDFKARFDEVLQIGAIAQDRCTNPRKLLAIAYFLMANLSVEGSEDDHQSFLRFQESFG
jgi:hypothetical protein